MLAGELVMSAGKGDEAALEGVPHVLRNLAAGGSLGGERLHGRERILDAVVELVDERLLAGFGFLPLRYVDQHVDRPDELAGGVAQRRREGDERHPPPVGRSATAS